MRFALLLPLGYGALALLAWVDFVRLPPDGLANVGLMLAVLPVTAINLLLSAWLGSGAIIMPDGFGYRLDHALYFFPATAAIAFALFLIGGRIDRRRRAR